MKKIKPHIIQKFDVPEDLENYDFDIVAKVPWERKKLKVKIVKVEKLKTRRNASTRLF